MIPFRILGTGSALPPRERTTEELVREATPDRDPAAVVARTGIVSRRWAEPGARMADLGAEALRAALAMARISALDLRRILFVSSTGGDALVPATAHAVCRAMDIDETADAIDVNNACLGFLSALDLGGRSVATGCSPVAIVVCEFMSAYVSRADPRPYVVFGDAAAAVVIGPGDPGEGIVGHHFASSGRAPNASTIAHPRLTGALGTVSFGMSNRDMSEGAVEMVAASCRKAAAAAGVAIDDIAWVLPHQPNGRMFEAMLAAIGAPAERAVPIVGEVGSTAAAAIPLSLDRLYRSGRVRAGDKILMAGIGSGVAVGALVYATTNDMQ